MTRAWVTGTWVTGARRSRRRVRLRVATACAVLAGAGWTGGIGPWLAAQGPAANAGSDVAPGRIVAGGRALGAATLPPTPGESLSVALMTIGQGDEVWARFGHNAIVIRDARTGAEIAYNWGMFDFNQPNFLGRFLSGDTKYWMQGFPAGLLADHYASVENRDVTVQELALTPVQRAALRDFIAWNEQPENRFYRYDYYRDNCSTRVRDALDRVLGGQLRTAFGGVPTGTSYRWHTRRLLDGEPAAYAGIQLALGRAADAPIDAWGEAFLPVRMMERLRGVRVRATDGSLVPLVRSERMVYRAPRPPEATTQPSHVGAFALGGIAVALVFALGAWLAAAAGGVGRLAYGLAAGTWTLVLGLLGTALLLAGTVTKHAPYMGRNWNLLGANPLALLVAALVVIALAGRVPAARARWGARAAGGATLLAVLTVVGAVFVLLPGVGQRSGELFALLVPANVALAASLAWWERRSVAAAPVR